MKLFKALLPLLLVAAACTSNPVLDIQGGKVRGVKTGDVTVFKGIPYAAAPVGELRWKAPQPVTAWEGILEADTFSKVAPQPGQEPGSFYWKEFYWEGTPEESEDCLYLNVWAPSGTLAKPETKLPVAMWIHGGAYHNGYGFEITMDGQEWAKRGVILVTINYRMGALGFLSHPELTAEGNGTSGNYGMLDQIAALDWIKANIAQFGGDPDNVTIFGQSAGASSVKNLAISPLSKGKISKAIIQSGGGLSARAPRNLQPDQAFYDAQGKAAMDYAGFTDLAKMRAASVEEIDAAVAGYTAEFKAPVSLRPHADGIVMSNSFDGAVYASEVADVPYMIGCNSEDMGGLGGPAIARFGAVRDSLSNQPVYQYYFTRNLPGDEDPENDAFVAKYGKNPANIVLGETGAFHSAELWYVFGTLDNSWRPFTEADRKLSSYMLDAWTGFCKNGTPGWDAAPYCENLDVD